MVSCIGSRYHGKHKGPRHSARLDEDLTGLSLDNMYRCQNIRAESQPGFGICASSVLIFSFIVCFYSLELY